MGSRPCVPAKNPSELEVTGGLLGGHGDDRELQASPDGLRDLSGRNALLGKRRDTSLESCPWLGADHESRGG